MPQVQPKHVKEGFRLLNKSIIRVETPDINFDEDEQIINGGWCQIIFPADKFWLINVLKNQRLVLDQRLVINGEFR